MPDNNIAQELTKEIYDNYPKVWRKLELNQIERTDLSFYTKCVHNQIMCMTDVPHSHMGILPLNMLYGLLEDFFEENGIIINIIHRNTVKNKKPFQYQLHVNFILTDDVTAINNKNEAKQQAILKACEIMEPKNA